MLDRPDRATGQRRRAWALLLLTTLSVFGTRWVWWTEGWGAAALSDAARFSIALMFILGSHEVGHLLAARRHRFGLSVPWFLPVPFWIGTLGAIIALEERPRTRTGLAALGASGPLAGVLATLLVAWWWQGSPAVAPDGWTLSTPLLLQPFSGERVLSTADPLGFAAWIGCLVTALNLIPFGQLDGGHVLAAVSRDVARRVQWPLTGLLLLAGFAWWGWAAWAAMLHLAGGRGVVRVRDDGRNELGTEGWVWVAIAVLLWTTTVTLKPF